MPARPPSLPSRLAGVRDPGLRALPAERFCGRGLTCDADELLVTTGPQQALGLVAAVLLDPATAG